MLFDVYDSSYFPNIPGGKQMNQNTKVEMNLLEKIVIHVSRSLKQLQQFLNKNLTNVFLKILVLEVVYKKSINGVKRIKIKVLGNTPSLKTRLVAKMQNQKCRTPQNIIYFQ